MPCLQLWINDGTALMASGGGFTAASGDIVAATSTNSLVAVWADADGDGDADLVRPPLTTNPSLAHLVCHPVRPHRVPCVTPSLCLQFVGNGGTNVSGGLFFGEVDGSAAANELWINDGTGVFSAASGAIVSSTHTTRAAAWADVDGDGDVDLVSRPTLQPPAPPVCSPPLHACTFAVCGQHGRGQRVVDQRRKRQLRRDN